MSITNFTFSKLYNEDKSQIFRVKVEWEEDYFRLFLLEGNKAWFALVTNQHLTNLSEQHELNLHAYIENLREYICNSPTSVTVDISTKKAEFIIYRHVEKEKFKVKYFVTKLEKLDYHQYVDELIDSLTSKCEDTSNKLLEQDKQKLEVEEQKLLLQHKCEEFAEMKNKSDHQIYSAVALVLNEKKNRIQYLTELLEEYQSGSKRSTKPITSIKRPADEKLKTNIAAEVIEPKPSTSRREVMSDSDSNPSDGYNTDDEACSNAQKADGDDLDFLGGESPPPALVPKRFKADEVSLQSDFKDNEQASMSNSKNTKAEISKGADMEEKSQSSQHFGTQDWLDMM